MADTNLLVLAKEFSKLRSDVKEVLKMPVGPEGKQGERGLPGKDGKDGLNGRDGIGVQGPPGAPGRDGRDGKDGKDGIDGQDGVSVTNAYIDFDGSLVIELSNGNQIDAGFVSVESRDNIVQQLKNGALSLNELLPSQTGNANKYLKTDGENTSWDTLTGSDIDLSSPGPIGSTTPAAATFTTLTATGQTEFQSTSVGGPTIVLLRNSAQTGGYMEFAVTDGTRYAELGLAKSGVNGYGNTNEAFLRASGSTTGLNISSSSSNPIRFSTGAAGSSTEQLRVINTASAVNYVQVTGSATGGRVSISAQGSDSGVGITYNTKSSQNHVFTTNAGNVQFAIVQRANAVNWGQVQGGVAGSPVTFSVDGSDTNIDLALTPKGTGLVRFGTYTAGAPTATGYISIKAANGTTYKVLVGT